MTIDRKFEFTATNPVNGNEYTHEDALVLCAKDLAVLPALEAYHKACIELGCSDEHIESVGLLLERVKQYQLDHPELIKIPDTEDGELLRCIHGEGV